MRVYPISTNKTNQINMRGATPPCVQNSAGECLPDENNSKFNESKKKAYLIGSAAALASVWLGMLWMKKVAKKK